MAIASELRKYRYHALRSAGLCVSTGCGKDALPGRTMCEMHTEKRRKSSAKWGDEHKGWRHEYHRRWTSILPPVCIDCGEDRYCFLELDHKNGGGSQQRRKSGRWSARDWLAAHPEDAYLFEVRCVMCHAIKTANQKIARIKESTDEC